MYCIECQLPSLGNSLIACGLYPLIITISLFNVTIQLRSMFIGPDISGTNPKISQMGGPIVQSLITHSTLKICSAIRSSHLHVHVGQSEMNHLLLLFSHDYIIVIQHHNKMYTCM